MRQFEYSLPENLMLWLPLELPSKLRSLVRVLATLGTFAITIRVGRVRRALIALATTLYRVARVVWKSRALGIEKSMNRSILPSFSMRIPTSTFLSAIEKGSAARSGRWPPFTHNKNDRTWPYCLARSRLPFVDGDMNHFRVLFKYEIHCGCGCARGNVLRC